jgi:hypothetical protein
VYATVETRDYHVRFPFLLDTNMTIYARQDKAFTVSANETSILSWQSGSGSHGDFPRYSDITLSQVGVFMNGLSGKAEESMDALQSYLSSGVHIPKDSSAQLPLSFYEKRCSPFYERIELANFYISRVSSRNSS